MFNDVTGFQWLTFAMACVGAATGLASLGWSIRQYFLTSYRIRVEATHGVTVDTTNLTHASWNITVRVMNDRPAAITVRDIEVQPVYTPNRAISWTEWAGGPGKLPNVRMEGRSEQTWRIDNPEQLRAMLRSFAGERGRVRFVVILAGGKKRVRSNSLVIHPDELEGLTVQLVTTKDLPKS